MSELALLSSAFVTLIVTIAPFETAPIFGTLTRGMDKQGRRRVACRAVAIAGGVLFGFALFGEWLLGVLHVSLPALRTAGGILLFLEAIKLMFASPHLSSLTEEEKVEARSPRDITVFPLAFPLIAGPGSLLAVVLLMSQAQGNLLHIAGVLVVLGICLGITLAALSLADPLMRLIGMTGSDVIGRLSGLLLAALAMQFIFDGVNAGLLESFRLPSSDTVHRP